MSTKGGFPSTTSICTAAFDEMLEAGVCVVEWSEKAQAVFPDEHLAVTLSLLF